MTDQKAELKPGMRNKEWYDSRKLGRYTIVLHETHKDILQGIGDKYNLSQNAVIEVVLDNYVAADDQVLAAKLAAKAASAATLGRPPKDRAKAAVNKLLKDMTPEQLTAAKEMLFGLKASATES